MLTPSGPMGQTHWGDAASNNPNPSTHSADTQLKVQPSPIFLSHTFFSSKNINAVISHAILSSWSV